MIDLYWGVEADEWDSPELQKTRMKLLEDCLKSSAGPCFVVGIKIMYSFTTIVALSYPNMCNSVTNVFFSSF